MNKIGSESVRSSETGRTLFFSFIFSVFLHVLLLGMFESVSLRPADVYGEFSRLFVRIPPSASPASLVPSVAISPKAPPKKAALRQLTKDLPVLAEVRGNDEKVLAENESVSELKIMDGGEASSTYYFSVQEVDIPPYVIDDKSLNPEGLLGYVGAGRMVLGLWISEQGLITKIEVRESNMPEFASEAVRLGFEQSTFVPAKRAGVSVNAWMRVEVEFSPPGRIFPRKR